MTPDSFPAGNRYFRHLLLPGFTTDTQNRLASARVLVIGAGGLSSTALYYLAAAGVGTIGIIDDDTVDITNLQRQILHDESWVGQPKIQSAIQRLSAFSSTTNFRGIPHRLTPDNARSIIQEYDLVLDGSDNFPTRYLVDSVCSDQKKPWVYAAVSRFEWQVSVFHPTGGGPCYRCVFPTPPPAGLYADCATAGVLGVIPGLAGLNQALETIKLLTGIGKPLIGQLLISNGLTQEHHLIRVARQPHCPGCGPNPEPLSIPAAAYCRVPVTGATLDPTTFSEKINQPDTCLIDVRTPEEYITGHLTGARLIPLANLEGQLSGLNREHAMLVYCKSGVRSRQAAAILQAAGFSRIEQLEGGILRWIAAGFPTESTAD